MQIAFVLLVLFLGSAMLFTSCSKDDDNVNTTGKTYVLVHGAWQAAYSWNQVKAELEARGNRVIAVELPGHGTDQTDPAGITMDSYKAKVIAAIQAEPGKVILVGHSLGGVVVSITAEAIPEKIERLIYVGAFIPKSGEALGGLAFSDTESQLKDQLRQDGDLLKVADLSLIPKLFCDDASDAIKQELSAKYRPDPSRPFGDPIVLTAQRFGSVAKAYVRTTKDLAVGMILQNRMLKDAGITDIHDIASSHCPHLSKPKELTELLINIAK